MLSRESALDIDLSQAQQKLSWPGDKLGQGNFEKNTRRV